jgi:long-chain-fatty-acid--CoA ligase ACSBG
MDSYTTCAAIGGVSLAAYFLLLKQGKYDRQRYIPQSPEYVSQYSKSDKVVDCRPNGIANIRYSMDGQAAERFPTLGESFKQCVVNNGDKIALRIEENNHTSNVGPWKEMTWRQYYDKSAKFAKALLSLGFEQHKSVAVCAFNACEWHISHMGVVMAGGKSAGIYTTNGPEACLYVADHSEATVVVVDTLKNMQKFLEIKDQLPLVKKLVVFLEAVPADVAAKYKDWVIGFNDFLALGDSVSDAVLDKRAAEISPAHCCSLIYTSGTTGMPKACMISHDSIQFDARSVFSSAGEPPGAEEHVVSYLPLSHIAAQLIDICMPLTIASKPGQNCTCHFARPDVLKGTLSLTLKAARPTMFLGVPRVWEKIVEGVKEKAKAAPLTGLKKKLVDWCKDVGLRAAIAQQIDGDGVVPRGYTIADKVLFSKVKGVLGLDRCRYCITGAAPITKETLMFLASLGIIVYELYGMSESTGATTVSGKKCWKWGACGYRINGAEVKIFHEDGRDKPNEGEICFRGRHIMMGYMKQEDKTREAIDAEGWLHSGDVGCFDEHGLLHITGRIKELIIGAGGENIAPVPIEDELKRLMPALSNVVMIGDKRKYNVLLVALKAKQDMTTGSFTDDLTNEALTVNPAVRTVSAALTDKTWNDYIKKGVSTYNEGKVCVSNAQKIQYFKILPTDLSIPGGELTPTMKLKRNVINDNYKALIDSMYKD